MNSINMPGFTAETSLYRTNANYRLARLPSPLGPSVAPALCFPDGCRPCINGKQRCCEGGHIIIENCESDPPPPTCGRCVGFRQCSDGTQKPCSV